MLLCQLLSMLLVLLLRSLLLMLVALQWQSWLLLLLLHQTPQSLCIQQWLPCLVQIKQLLQPPWRVPVLCLPPACGC